MHPQVLFSHKALVRSGGRQAANRQALAPGETVVRLQVRWEREQGPGEWGLISPSRASEQGRWRKPCTYWDLRPGGRAAAVASEAPGTRLLALYSTASWGGVQHVCRAKA